VAESSIPKIIARYYILYIEYIKTINQLPMVVRADYGTENSVVRDLQIGFKI
jgi:hypothetical protein